METEELELIKNAKNAIIEIISFFNGKEESIPIRVSEVSYKLPSESETYIKKEQNYGKLYEKYKEGLLKLERSKEFDQCCDILFKKHDGALPHDLGSHSCQPIIWEYFNENKRFTYEEQLIEKITREYYKQVVSKSVNLIVVCYFENIKSKGQFRINNFCFHQITKNEIREYSTEYNNSFSSYQDWLNSESYIAKINIPLEKKDYLDYVNSTVFDIEADLFSSLQLSSENSAIRFKVLRRKISQKFLSPLRSSSQGFITHNLEPEVLLVDNSKIKEIKKINNQLKKIRSKPESLTRNMHYALERYFYCQSRTDPQDKVVDLVTGLESLLCADSKSEISYRFKLRGASLLNEKFGNIDKKINTLRDIYDLRSSIVHGSTGKKKLYSVGTEKIDLRERVEILLPVLYSVFSDVAKWYLNEIINLPADCNESIIILKELDRKLVSGVSARATSA